MSNYDEQLERMRIERERRVAAVTRPRPEALAAAKWWADRLRSKFRTDVGDGHLSGMIDGFRAMMGDSVKFPPSMIDSFEAELAAGIEGEIVEREERYTEGVARYGTQHGDGWGWYIHIGVDYHPDRMLAEAAARAGIEDNGFIFPSKTNMSVDRGKVTVSAGYGAMNKVVWMSPEGVSYWASDAMRRCQTYLADMASGIAEQHPELSAALEATSNRIEADRPKHHDKPSEPEPPREKPGEYGKGLGDSLTLCLELAGLRT